jgi:hypothetical protein
VKEMEQHIVVGFGGVYSAYTLHELKKKVAPEAIKLFFIDLFSDVSDEPLYLNNAQFMSNVASKLEVEFVNVDISKGSEKKVDTTLSGNIASKLSSFTNQITEMYEDVSKVTVHFPVTPQCLKGQNKICMESIENEWADTYEVKLLFEQLLSECFLKVCASWGNSRQWEVELFVRAT